MTTSIEEFISHHGVKGMKWGQRKARSSVTTGKSGGSGSSGSSGSKKKKKATTRTKFEKSPSRLSDAELQKRVKRMEIERKYNDLNKKDVSAGKKYASDILGGAAKNVAMTLIAGAALYGIGRAVQAKMGTSAATGITGKKLPEIMRTPLPPPAPGTRVK